MLMKYPEAIPQARQRLEEKLEDPDPGEFICAEHV
jgi:hypothetical protein